MMKLLRIKLKHFRSHSNTAMNLQQVNFIRGLNHTGKSGLAMGIEMALTGICDVTDEGGKGYDNLIQQGAQSASVMLELDSGAVITLSMDRSNSRSWKVQIDRLTIIGTQAREWIAENIAPPSVIRACLNASRFLTMSKNEQATLLAQVLLPEQLPIDTEIAACLTANNLRLAERDSLFQTIEDTYKAIANERTIVDRKIRDLKNIVEPDPVTTNRDEIKTKIRALQTEQTEINTKLLILSNHAAVAKQAKEQLASLEAQIETQRQLLAKQPDLLSLECRKKLMTTASCANRHVVLRRTLASDQVTLKTVTEMLEKLSQTADEKGTCPTCNAPLTEESRKAMFQPLLTQQNEANASISRIEKQLTSDGDPAEASRKLDADAQVSMIRTQIQERIEELTNRADACRKPPAALTPMDEIKETAEELQEQAKQIKSRIVKGLESLEHVVALEERQNEYKRQLSERTAAETRLTQLQKLLTYFGPTGIKAKLIAERLDVFAAKVNQVLEYWGYSMSFSIEPYALQITESSSGVTLMPNQLSDSEAYRLGVAFSIAIANWTGFGLMIADGAEILDKTDKWHLAQLLLQNNNLQALMLYTGVGGTFDAPGTTFYTLSRENGNTAYSLDREQEAEQVTCQ